MPSLWDGQKTTPCHDIVDCVSVIRWMQQQWIQQCQNEVWTWTVYRSLWIRQLEEEVVVFQHKTTKNNSMLFFLFFHFLRYKSQDRRERNKRDMGVWYFIYAVVSVCRCLWVKKKMKGWETVSGSVCREWGIYVYIMSRRELFLLVKPIECKIPKKIFIFLGISQKNMTRVVVPWIHGTTTRVMTHVVRVVCL